MDKKGLSCHKGGIVKTQFPNGKEIRNSAAAAPFRA